MAFFEAEFPRSIQFQRVGGQGFSTDIIVTQSGQEQRNRNWRHPRAEYQASLITPASAQGALLQFIEDVRTFFLMVGGMRDGFRYLDPLDCSAVSEPMASLGGGVYQLQKTYTLGGRSYVRKITKPITSAVVDYKGLSLSNPPYNVDDPVITGGTIVSIDETTGQVTLSGVSGTPSASFKYHIPVRLTEDKFEPEVEESDVVGGNPVNRWTLGMLEARLPDISSIYTADIVSSPTWTGPTSPPGSPPPGPPLPNPGPTQGGGSGSGSADLLATDWILMQLSDRPSFHMQGTTHTYYIKDTDALWPAGYPTSGWFAFVKNNSGHPWDIERYDSSYALIHVITENGNVSGGWNNQYGYKRSILGVPVIPRNYTLGGSPVTIDTPGPNTSHITTDCENNYTVGHLGDVRCITSGPFSMAWGGDVGTQPTLKNQYFYGGHISTGIFKYCEETFFVQGFGRICWKFFVNGSFVQQNLNNYKVAGAVAPYFPCGAGKPWWV